MTRDEVLRFVHRWDAVREFEIEELSGMSFDEALRKTAAAMRLGRGLGFSFRREDDPGVAAVRRRWVSLKGTRLGR